MSASVTFIAWAPSLLYRAYSKTVTNSNMENRWDGSGGDGDNIKVLTGEER